MRVTEGAVPPRAGGRVTGYDQWKLPELPPADQDPVGESEVAVKSPAEPAGAAVAARTVAEAETEAEADAAGEAGVLPGAVFSAAGPGPGQRGSPRR